jgi:DNA-directed RNA polymerase subunit M/transcription elongation factor TFIIS
MADIEFTCPECGQVLEAPEEMAGESLACPSCEAPISIPDQENSKVDEEYSALVFDNLPDTSATDPYAETADNVCPECGAKLNEGVVLCVQCGFHLKLGKKISTEFD